MQSPQMMLRADSRRGNRPRRVWTSRVVSVPIAGAVGIFLEYLFDPDRGKGRRRKLADHSRARLRRQERKALAQARYTRGRLQGSLLRAVGAGSPEPTDDVEVKQQIHRDLRAAGVSLRDISIEVSDRKAVLRGQVGTRAEIDRIEQIAARSAGVHEVKNLLHEPGEPAPNKIDALRLSHSQ